LPSLSLTSWLLLVLGLIFLGLLIVLSALI